MPLHDHVISPEVTRLGPPICSSQWTMEHTIGNLGEEIWQLSNPYANLSQRGLLRCQVNALKAMILNLPQHFLMVELTLVKISLVFVLRIDMIKPCNFVKLSLSKSLFIY
jgi:hypothetical protein